MEKIKIDFDSENNTLIIWFDTPEQMAYLSPIDEATPGDWHLIKREDDSVIGLECQLYHIPPGNLEIDIHQRNEEEITTSALVGEMADRSDQKHMSLDAFEQDGDNSEEDVYNINSSNIKQLKHVSPIAS